MDTEVIKNSKFNSLDNIRSNFSPKRLEMSKKYIFILAESLNELHQTRYSFKFWSLVLQGYVGSVISNLESYEKNNSKHWITNDYVNGFGKPSVIDKFKSYVLKKIKYINSFSNKKKINNLLKRYNSLHIGFPEIAEVDQDLGQRLPMYYPHYHFFFNKKLRRRLAGISTKCDDVVISNIIKGLPKLYVEGFKRVLDGIPLINPQQKVFHYHIGNQYFNLFVAKYVEEGSKLFWYQHGAFYGEMIFGSHVRERALADKYRTWGWKIEQKDEPWKAYRLIDFNQKYKSNSGIKEFDILIPLGLMPKNYKVRIVYLFSNLDRSKYKNILVRPRPNNKIFSNRKNIFSIKDSNVHVSSGLKAMYKEMHMAKLIIQMNIPSTNFLECIAVNYPTIGLLTNDQPTEIIKPFYDFFLDNGVLHNDMESLTNFLNENDIDLWWSELIHTNTYIQFKNRFLGFNHIVQRSYEEG